MPEQIRIFHLGKKFMEWWMGYITEAISVFLICLQISQLIKFVMCPWLFLNMWTISWWSGNRYLDRYHKDIGTQPVCYVGLCLPWILTQDWEPCLLSCWELYCPRALVGAAGSRLTPEDRRLLCVQVLLRNAPSPLCFSCLPSGSLCGNFPHVILGHSLTVFLICADIVSEKDKILFLLRE